MWAGRYSGTPKSRATFWGPLSPLLSTQVIQSKNKLTNYPLKTGRLLLFYDTPAHEPEGINGKQCKNSKEPDNISRNS